MASTRYNGTNPRDAIASTDLTGQSLIPAGTSIDHRGGQPLQPWVSNVYRGWAAVAAGAQISSESPITFPTSGSVTGWIHLDNVTDQPIIQHADLSVAIVGGQLSATMNGSTVTLGALAIVAADWFCWSLKWTSGGSISLSAIRRSTNDSQQVTAAFAAYTPTAATLHWSHDGAGAESTGLIRELCVFDAAGTLVDAWVKTVSDWQLFQADLHNDIVGRVSMDAANFAAITWPRTLVAAASQIGVTLDPQHYTRETFTGRGPLIINSLDATPNPQLLDAYTA